MLTNLPSKEPVAGTPFTDDDGSIIDFPIIDGGGPYVEAPTVLISGQGYGASGIALLDDMGISFEIRITNPGRGYVINKANNSGRSCVIDSLYDDSSWTRLYRKT